MRRSRPMSDENGARASWLTKAGWQPALHFQEFNLQQNGYRLITNGGRYQDVPTPFTFSFSGWRSK